MRIPAAASFLFGKMLLILIFNACLSCLLTIWDDARHVRAELIQNPFPTPPPSSLPAMMNSVFLLLLDQFLPFFLQYAMYYYDLYVIWCQKYEYQFRSTLNHCSLFMLINIISISLPRVFLHEEVQISGLVYYVRLVKVFIRLHSCQNMYIPVVYQGVNSLLKAYDTILYLLHINVDLCI